LLATLAEISLLSKTVIMDFLYSPENYEELAKFIDILAEDHELRKLMGKRSIEILSNNFTPSSAIRNFLRIIRTVLK